MFKLVKWLSGTVKAFVTKPVTHQFEANLGYVRFCYKKKKKI